MGMSALVARVGILLIAVIIIVGAGTIGFVEVEGLTPSDALYFTVVTVGTVGYGDIHPVTPAGKMLAIVLIVTGVGTFAAVLTSSAGLVIERRQNEMKRHRMNSLVGLFYSEVGSRMIVELLSADPLLDHLCRYAVVRQEWNESHFKELRLRIERHEYAIDHAKIPFERLRDLLREKTDILLRLFENPSLIEQESFTELLRSTLHFREELVLRQSLQSLPDSDIKHLAVDAKRVYRLLARDWLQYLRYLKKAHPYLFSLALRTNPFDESCSPVVQPIDAGSAPITFQ
jgi:hypothetical protein